MAAYNSQLAAIGPVNLTQNGTVTGTVSVTSTVGWYTGQTVSLSSTAGVMPNLIVTEVISPTQFVVNTQNGAAQQNFGKAYYTDISAFTTALGSTVSATLQMKNKYVPSRFVTLDAFEGAPIVAIRTMSVDNTGNYVSTGNSSITILNPSLTVSIGASTAAGFQYAQVNALSITSGNSSQTTGFPIMTLANNSVVLQFVGNMSVSTGIAVGGTVATSSEIIALPPAGSFSIDFGANSRYVASGQVISLFSYNASVTATGFVSVTAVS